MPTRTWASTASPTATRQDMRLEISGYVRWTDGEFGGLALADERTGVVRDSCNH